MWLLSVRRIWIQWLRSYKEWVPGTDAVAAAAAADAVKAAGGTEEEASAAAVAAAEDARGGNIIFVTASATLKEQVRKAFRRMQAAAMPPAEYRDAEAAGRATYHSMSDVPREAFPLFLSARQYLHMLDATLPQPFFRRRPNGAILQVCCVLCDADVAVAVQVGAGGCVLCCLFMMAMASQGAVDQMHRQGMCAA